MTAYTDFHYSPTGSGVISGAQVLEQTEQGINGLGQYVQDNISGAIDTANQALTIAQTADSNATLALNTANSFASAISAANNTANNALTTAQSAQNTANAASSLATTANNNAATALNTANSASAGVTALTGTVNSLGNRMTAAENAINTNAGNITTLQNGLATTNANVTAAANAASAAQATATSAQSTATLARNQAYVLRYTGTTITGGGTIAYADIDNTDNIKAGDKIIDATGAIYEIASVDIANETVTVSASEIINLAVLPDLFNSANTWTGDNTYTKYQNAVLNGTEIGVAPNSQNRNGLVFQDKNNATLGWVRTVYDPSGDLSIEMLVTNKYSNGALNPAGTQLYQGAKQTLTASGDSYFSWSGRVNNNVVPRTNKSYDLGSSSYQWNNLYAKNYYYNGTAWGLDKNNWWSLAQFYSQNSIHVRNVEPGVVPSSDISAGIKFENANASYAFADIVGKVFTSGTTFVNLIASNKFTNGALDPNGTTVSKNLQIGIRSNGTGFIYTDCGWRCNLVPPLAESGVYSLGTSTSKWKTLNGINPGALGLPSGNYDPIDTDGWDFTGATGQSYTPTVHGWLFISIQNTAGNYLSIVSGRGAISIDGTGAQNGLRAMLPVIANESVVITVKTGAIFTARFYPMQGNVS